MSGFSVIYCRICGCDMNPEQNICVKCGGMRTPDQKRHSTGMIILLVVGGLIAIILLGIASGFAVPVLHSILAMSAR